MEEIVRKRVVITGLGTVSPLGNDVKTTWTNLVSGKSGAGPITHFDSSQHKSQIAAEVKEFDAGALIGSRETRRMDRCSQFTMVAVQEALAHAELTIDDANRDRVGAVIGTGIGGLGTLSTGYDMLSKRGPMRVSPFLIPMMLPDTSGAMIAIRFGIRGPNFAVVTACATGSNAIGEATEVIRRGQADAMFAGGTEAGIVPVAMAGLDVMGALTTRNDDPESASRPFDLNRDGFLMGEGAAVLVLESLEHAQARGAQILCEARGYGSNNDAFHISAPAENGAGAARCMRMALDDAQLTTEQISYINAHGTSTPLNDKNETAAIKKIFGEHAYDIPISSTKSMVGHLLGASGALEALVCVKSIENQQIHPTINYETPDPDCDLDYVPNQPRTWGVEHAMSNSFGFGGHNATLIFSRFEEVE